MLLSSKLDSSAAREVTLKDKNKRFFSVEFQTDQANGWQLTKEQHVDIIFVPQKAADSVDNGIIMLHNIRIAALIDIYGNIIEKNSKEVLPKYISFEVTTEQAEFLAYAKGNGRLELAAREW